MSKWGDLKSAIANVIKTNGTQAITGSVLQSVLNNIVSSLGENYQFVGIATTATNPGAPDGNVFYIAGEGTYTNFSNLVIDTGQIGVLKWSGSWTKQTMEIGSSGMILDWNTDIATTRKQVLTKYRKPGVQISYKEPDKGWVNEQYVGTLTTDTEWAKDSNWDEIPNQILISNLERKLTENDYSVCNEVYSNITKTKDGNFANYAIQSNGTTAFARGFQSNIYEVEQDKKYLVKIESNAPDENNKFIPYAFYNVKPTTSVTVSNVISVAEASELQGTSYFIITAPEDATYILVETKGTTNIELKEITDSHIKEIDNSIIDLGNRDYEGKAGLQNGCYPIFGFDFGSTFRVSYNTNANYGYGNLVNHDGKIITGFISINLGENPIYSVRVNEETGEVVRLKQLQIKSKTLYNKVFARDNYYLYKLDANSYITNDNEQIAISVIKSSNAFSGRAGKIFNINADLVSGNIEATTDKDIAIGYIYADDDLGFTESDRQNIIKSQNMTFDDVVLNIVDETALKSSVHSNALVNSGGSKRMVFLFNMSNNVILGIYSESDRISSQNVSYGIATKLGENLFEFGENIETLQTGRVVIFSKPLILAANQYMYIENTDVFGYTKAEVDNKIDVLVNNIVEYSITKQAPNFALIQPLNNGLYKNPYNATLQPYNAPRYFTETFNVECSNPIITAYESISPTQIQEEKIFEGTAYIMVPYKYGLKGKKKYPLALYCHAGNTNPTDIQNDQIAIYLCSLGYVVAGTTTPIGYATELGVADRLRNAGNYACMNAYVQLYKYLTANYKIDIDRVFAFGASQGGFTSLNLAEITNIPIKAVSLNCPVLSMYYGQWFLDKENVKAYYGFDDAITYQPDKVIGYDPYIRNAEDVFTDLSESAAPTFINEKTLSDVTMKRYTNIPIRIFAGTADASVGYIMHQVFTKAVKNAGGNIALTIWEGKGHMASDVIGTIEYTGLDSKDRGTINVTATAYETALWFSRYGGIKPEKI